MNYDSVCYRNSCLSKVIIRLDFLEFTNTELMFDEQIVRGILETFPKKGMQQLIRFQTTNFTANSYGTRAEQTTNDGVQQEFLTNDNNKLILSNKFFVLEFTNYDRFESALRILTQTLKPILSKHCLTVLRTGIRYVNMFDEKGIKPQKNYFSSAIGSLLEAKMDSNHCMRSMALNEYLFEDMHLNFRYGMYNPQYPQVIRSANYVLDYDCFSDEAIKSYESIIQYIQKGHDFIQTLFESSITDQLRKVMKYNG